MCGIVGYLGDDEAAPFLLDGLSRLEYRGYDSAGLALLEGETLYVRKTAGRVAELARKIQGDHLTATAGIAHTRWATHGPPTDENAHPHQGCGDGIAVAHNGIVENWRALREGLEARGHTFRSQTDTEVLAHLIEEHQPENLLQAVSRALEHVQGSLALAVVAKDDPDRIVVARRDSPLVIGIGAHETVFASDFAPILVKTRSALVLDDGEVADITRQGVRIYRQGRLVEKEPIHIPWSVEQAEKGGHPHFMIKEIFEQAKAVRDCLSGRMDEDIATLPELDGLGVPSKIWIVACGTSYHAGLVGKVLLEEMASIPCEVEIASEFRYRRALTSPGHLAIVISQSGETSDTLAALREMKRRGVETLAVTNVLGSSIFREADRSLLTRAGPEIAVASSKAYTTQLVCLILLAIWFAQRQGLEAQRRAEVLAGLRALPAHIDEVLSHADAVRETAQIILGRRDVFFIGRGLDHAVALEGQLKLKEISYVHAEALASGELKHGTLALIEEGVPVVAVLSQVRLLDKSLGNVAEVRARGGVVIGLLPAGREDAARQVQHVIWLPQADPALMPVLTIVPLQLLAYEVGTRLGIDVDHPRNLAKSVTVE